MDAITPSAVQLLETIAVDLRGDVLVLGGCSLGTAAKVVPHCDRVIQVCFDQTSAQEAHQLYTDQELAGIMIEVALPDQLPDIQNHFGAVLCLDGSQRVEHLERWLVGLRRIMKPDGVLLLHSHLVPGSRLRGKKGRLQREAGDYVNAFCRLRCADHHRYCGQDQWQDMLDATGFYVQQAETAEASFDFSVWAGACSPNRLDLLRLKAMLIQAPEKAYEFLTPRFSGDRIIFRLPEITILAKSKANLDNYGQSEGTANLTRQAD